MSDELPERIWIERGENSGGHMGLLVVPGHDGGDEYVRADLATPAPQWQPISSAPKDQAILVVAKGMVCEAWFEGDDDN